MALLVDYLKLGAIVVPRRWAAGDDEAVKIYLLTKEHVN